MNSISTNQSGKRSQLLHDISDLNFHYGKYQAYITAIDLADLRKHNLKYPKGSDFHLHEELTPCPFEGDLLKANIYLLLTNPGTLSVFVAQLKCSFVRPVNKNSTFGTKCRTNVFPES